MCARWGPQRGVFLPCAGMVVALEPLAVGGPRARHFPGGARAKYQHAKAKNRPSPPIAAYPALPGLTPRHRC